MKRVIVEKGLMIFLFMLFFIIMEAITFRWMNFSVLPEYFIVDMSLAFLLSSIILLIKSNKLSFAYLAFLFAIDIALYMINATMHDVYFDLFTLQQLQLIGEAAAVFRFEFLSIDSIVTASVVSLIFLLSYLLLLGKFKKRSPIRHYYPKALPLAAFLSLFAFALLTSQIPAFEKYSNLENITTYKRANLQKFGTFGYYLKEAENLLEIESDSNAPEIVTTAPPSNNQSDQSTIDTGESPIDPIDPITQNLSEPTEYFGLLEGKNIITIMLESGQPFAINEVLTPNLYYLTQAGLYFANTYSENKTNVSEMLGIAGNVPTKTFNPGFYTYDLPFTLPNRLKDEYKTAYFHDNVASFYLRGDLMPQLGFEEVFLHPDIYPKEEIWAWDGDYTLDSLTMSKILPELVDDDEPFYSYWTSLSSHGPYDYGEENKLLFEELGYFPAIRQAEKTGQWHNILSGSTDKNKARIRHYQAAIMDFDRALGLLLNELSEKDLMDDTLICIYSDHNIYYSKLHLAIHDASSEQYYKVQMYETIFLLYNPLLTDAYLNLSKADDTTITKFASPHNIVPTILDLLGIQFDSNLYLADSIFDSGTDVFYSHKLPGLFNENFFSDDGESIIYSRSWQEEAVQTQFLADCAAINQKFDYINQQYQGVVTQRDDD
ncbi:MAG: sulfatase-like hydrolase/transferase [Candidatus Izemoplasmatales bacterium]|nr:sulfatase-like hydrolase/transferase [Candidatus Izemoplasmatales bacterium]